jgi:hypothetical protein
VSFAAITLCVASQRVFIVVRVYFVVDSIRKLLDTPSYIVEQGEDCERGNGKNVEIINRGLFKAVSQCKHGGT